MPHRRISPKTTAEELSASLEGALRFIKRYYGNSDPKTRTVEVLDLLQRHLDELGVDRSLTRPLNDLQLAFREAERGRLVALFEPKKLMARPPIELRTLFVRIHASLAMDLLMATKKSREEAARRVASELKKLGFPIEGKIDIPDWKSVQGWREELVKAGKGASSHGPDWTRYGIIYLEDRKRILQQVRDAEINPEAEAKRQLKTIARRLL